MVRKCAVPGCKAKNLQVQKLPHPAHDIHHRFQSWLDAINSDELRSMPPMQVYLKRVICRDHFTDDCFLSNIPGGRLKRDAVPNKNLPGSEPVPSITIIDLQEAKGREMSSARGNASFRQKKMKHLSGNDSDKPSSRNLTTGVHTTRGTHDETTSDHKAVADSEESLGFITQTMSNDTIIVSYSESAADVESSGHSSGNETESSMNQEIITDQPVGEIVICATNEMCTGIAPPCGNHENSSQNSGEVRLQASNIKEESELGDDECYQYWVVISS